LEFGWVVAARYENEKKENKENKNKSYRYVSTHKSPILRSSFSSSSLLLVSE